MFTSLPENLLPDAVTVPAFVEQQAQASVVVRRVVEAADGVVLHGGARAVADQDAVLGDVVDGTFAGDDVLRDRRGGLDVEDRRSWRPVPLT